MNSKFFFIIPLFALMACNDAEQAEEPVEVHPALLNPVVRPYTEAIAQDTANAELYYQRAGMLNKLELPELTQKDLETAVRLAAKNTEFRASLATLLIERKLSEQALTHIRILKEQAPADTNYILMESEAYLAGGKTKEADQIIQQLLAAKPRNPYILLNASKIKAAEQDTQAAISYAKTLAEVAPTFYDGLYQLADLYSAAKQKEALTWYEKLYRLDTLNANPYFDMAKYYQSVGDVKMAKQYFVKAIWVDKDFEKAYLDYGKLLLAEDSVEKADRQFQIATEVAPANAEAYYSKGLIYIRKGNKDLARNFFEQALVFNGNHEQAKAELAKLKAK